MRTVQKERLLVQEILPMLEDGANTVIQMKKQTSLKDNDLKAVLRFGMSQWIRTGGASYTKLKKTSPKVYIAVTK